MAVQYMALFLWHLNYIENKINHCVIFHDINVLEACFERSFFFVISQDDYMGTPHEWVKARSLSF